MVILRGWQLPEESKWGCWVPCLLWQQSVHAMQYTCTYFTFYMRQSQLPGRDYDGKVSNLGAPPQAHPEAGTARVCCGGQEEEDSTPHINWHKVGSGVSEKKNMSGRFFCIGIVGFPQLLPNLGWQKSYLIPGREWPGKSCLCEAVSATVGSGLRLRSQYSAGIWERPAQQCCLLLAVL